MKYTLFTKRIIKIDLDIADGESPEEIIKKAKSSKWLGQVVSDTFLVEDETGIIQGKEKTVYDGRGKEFTFDRAFPEA
jgi:hypothetical protein